MATIQRPRRYSVPSNRVKRSSKSPLAMTVRSGYGEIPVYLS